MDEEYLNYIFGFSPPEVFLDCPECLGEGAIEIWESTTKWSIDPPCAHVLTCQACNGSGGMICEAEGDQ